MLVDLKGYTRDYAVAVFAWRPAPVQVTCLGFPGTTGADYIDYLVGDPVVTPLASGRTTARGSRRCRSATSPTTPRARCPAPARAEWGLPEDALVLCGFNQPFKISAEVFDVWCGLLHALPQAVLWLLEWNANVQGDAHAAARAARHRPRTHRVRARAAAGRSHGAPAAADLFLDTWPCNAHTTASDALWAGVPVVTLTGPTFASRVAASLLHTVDWTNWSAAIARATAIRCSHSVDDPARRAAMRGHLGRSEHRPLFDGARFARDLEGLYLRMWQRATSGARPSAFPRWWLRRRAEPPRGARDRLASSARGGQRVRRRS